MVRSVMNPNGIAIDAQDRIYIADGDVMGATAHNRVVRTDDMNGTNFATYNASGQGNLSDPHGVALDSRGRIYIADYGHNRIVRIDDIAGSHITYRKPWR